MDDFVSECCCTVMYTVLSSHVNCIYNMTSLFFVDVSAASSTTNTQNYDAATEHVGDTRRGKTPTCRVTVAISYVL